MTELLRQLNGDLNDVTVFLLLSTSTKVVLEALCKSIAANESLFRERIVICSDSMYALYKVCDSLDNGIRRTICESIYTFIRSCAKHVHSLSVASGLKSSRQQQHARVELAAD